MALCSFQKDLGLRIDNILRSAPLVGLGREQLSVIDRTGLQRIAAL